MAKIKHQCLQCRRTVCSQPLSLCRKCSHELAVKHKKEIEVAWLKKHRISGPLREGRGTSGSLWSWIKPTVRKILITEQPVDDNDEPKG